MSRFIKIPEEEEYTNSLHDKEFTGGVVEDIRKKEIEEEDINDRLLDISEYEEEEKSGILSAILGILSACVVIGICAVILLFYKDFDIPVLSTFFLREESVELEETDDGMVVVPDICGYTETDAQRMLRDSKLGLREGETVVSNEPAGTIVSQEPSAGEAVNPHSAITYYKSSGPVQVKMPGLVGMQTSDAVTALKENGITNYKTKKVYQAGTFDSVISTDPAAGQLTSGEVTMTICAGSESTASPKSYLTLTESEAKAMARKDKLIPVVSYAYSDVAEPGTVMEQSLDADAPVMAGAIIRFTVSSGNASERFPLKETQPVLLSLPKTATGTPYRITIYETTSTDSFELLVEEGDAAPKFPHEIELKIARGMKTCKVVYYEKSDDTYIPRSEWSVKEEKKLREQNKIDVEETPETTSTNDTDVTLPPEVEDAMVVESIPEEAEAAPEETAEEDIIILGENNEA